MQSVFFEEWHTFYTIPHDADIRPGWNNVRLGTPATAGMFRLSGVMRGQVAEIEFYSDGDAGVPD